MEFMPIRVKLNPSSMVCNLNKISDKFEFIFFCQSLAEFNRRPRSYVRPTLMAVLELGPLNYITSRHVHRLGARPLRVDPLQPYTGIPNVREALPLSPVNT